jgi:hypothetical protein
MTRKIAFAGLLVAALFAFFGCSKKGSASLQAVNDAFIAAGFKLDSFHTTDGKRFGAEHCSAGELGGIDALVCEVTPAEQARAKEATEEWVAQAPTGVVLTNGATLLALADRSHADPHGRTIHKITQAYQKAR